jgi:trigger factor
MGAVDARVEELPDNKVRLEIDVDSDAIDHALEHAAGDLAKSMSFPGFRRGKSVPLPVVAARVGPDTLAAEAIRSHAGSWFWAAANKHEVRPVSEPELEWDENPQMGSPFTFRATVDVLPPPTLGDWTELEVGRPEPELPREVVDAELDQVRSSVATLSRVESRPAEAGDTVVVDLTGDEITRDYAIEVGHGRLRDEIEAAIIGSAVDETRSVTVDMGNSATAQVNVTVTEINEKVLPPLDDDLAVLATEFETLAELEADIEKVLNEQLEGEVDAHFREQTLDALANATTFDKLGPIVQARARSMWNGLASSLEQRGLQVENYLAATGQTVEQIDAQLRMEAERAVKRELTLEAVANKLEIEVTDEEIEELIAREAGDAGDDPSAAIELMRERGAFDKLRGDLRFKKALDEVVASVTPISVELAEAREELWTPEKEKTPSSGKLWTPGSEVNE